MRLSVIFDDELVMKDGVGYRVTLPNEPDVHAIQWTGATGEIEYRDQHTPNEAFDDELVLAPYLALWQAAHDAAIAPPSGPAPVPAKVHKYWLTKVLEGLGDMDDIEDALDAMAAAGNRAPRRDWQNATEIERANQLVNEFAAGRGYTAAQVDAIFVQAAALQAAASL